MTETAKLADVVLPATCYAEKDGTFTNSERRVQRVRKAVDPPGEARPDWQIICDLSTAMGYEMRYGGPSEVFAEMAALTPSYAGISYERIEKTGLQWPCPTKDHPGTAFLHEGRFTRGKGLMHAIRFRPPAEVPDEEYPFMLSTGRTLYHYNIGNMTRKSAAISQKEGEQLRRDARGGCTPAGHRRRRLGARDHAPRIAGGPRPRGRQGAARRPLDALPLRRELHQPADQRRLRQRYSHRRVQVLRRQGRKGRDAGRLTKEDYRAWPGFSWWIRLGTSGEALKRALGEAGWEVVVADDAAACRTTPADAIVLATDAAGLARAQAHVEAVREKSGTPVILVVDLDRSGWDRTFASPESLNVDALFDRPVDAQALVRRLAGILAAREDVRKLAAAPEMSSILDRAIVNEEAAAAFYRRAAERHFRPGDHAKCSNR